MGYEIDFLSTSSDAKSGDAIAVRFGNLHGLRSEQTVVVIDAGFTHDGSKVVEHVKNHYKTTKVDLVISTHPDQDHINGLGEVLDGLEVGELWLHLPWEHNSGLAGKFHDGRITDDSLGDRLRETLNKAHLLFEIAESKGIPIREPFSGLTDNTGAVRVLGPSVDYYESLIPEFDGMPAKKAENSMAEGLLRKAGAMMKRLFAVWGNDHIDDDGVTSAKNNTSVITQIIVDGKRLLFTGDAGVDALHIAANKIDACIDPASLSFIQVPHHGSRRNVGPTVLNRIVGCPVGEGERRPITAIASTALNGEPKHPRKSVMNAFTHRGVKVLATRGKSICHHSGSPGRDGWSSMDPEPYHWDFEEEA